MTETADTADVEANDADPPPDAQPAPDASAADVTAVAEDLDESPVDGVLTQVRERGFITTGEIFAAFPDLEPDTDELRDLYDMFESRGIKVLDEIAEEVLRRRIRRDARGQDDAQPPVLAQDRPVQLGEDRIGVDITAIGQREAP